MDISAIKTLDRLVEILDCFTLEEPAWSLAELSVRLKAPKSTLHRLLTALETHRILRRDPDDKRWRLGYRLVTWGSSAAGSTILRDLAKPVLRDLMLASGETAILTVYHNHEVFCIDICETPQPVRLRMEIGSRRPAHAGASSKALMAYLPQAEIEAIIHESGLPRLWSNTITDPPELRRDLARVVEQGYAISLEETDAGAWGVATPVCDQRGRVVAAVGLAGPATRYGPEKVQQWVSLCRKAAGEIRELIS
jgi:DNA-binding IclR family transcriptional regulator